MGNKLESVRWKDRGWKCQVRFGYDGDGRRLWKREYLPRPLGVVVRLTLYAGYGFEEGYVEEVQPHEAGDVCGKVEGVTDLGFTGQRQEISFGLYDYNARYLSPALGRFISPDPIVPDFSNPQALNRYSYVYNNPLKYIDPTGHCGIAGGGAGNPAVMSHSCLEALGGAAVAYAVAAVAANQFDLEVDLDLNLNRPSSGAPIEDTSVLIFVPGDPTDAAEYRTVTLDEPPHIMQPHSAPMNADFPELNEDSSYQDDLKIPSFLTSDVNSLLNSATPGRKTKGPSRIWDKSGGWSQAQIDFNALSPADIRVIDDSLQIGTLSDGRTVVVRQHSSQGTPTLEIQDGKKRIKIRYED